LTIPNSKQQSFVLIALANVTVLLAYGSTLQALFQRWTTWDGSQSHGLVIIALSIYLYCQRLEPGLLSKRIQPLLLTVITLISLLWALSAAISVDIIAELCLFALLVLMQCSLFGFKNVNPLLGPVGLLIFAIPVWDYLSPPLVELSSLIVTRMLNMSHLTAYIDGNSIFMPFGTIIIAGGCSGLRYLLIALALSIYLVLTSHVSFKNAVLIILTSAGLGLLVNWIRIYIIILIAYRTEMQTRLIENHETFGWVLFIFVILPMFFIANRLRVYEHKKLDWPFDKRSRKVVIVTVLIMIIGPLLLVLQSQALSKPDHIASLSSEKFLEAGFISADGELKSDPPPDNLVSLQYRDAGTTVTLISAFYWQKKTGDSLVPYMTDIIDTSAWHVVSRKMMKLEDGTSAAVMGLERKLTSERHVVVYWLKVGSFTTTRYKAAKLLQYPAVLSGQNLFEYTRLEANCPAKTCEAEREVMLDAANQFIVVLNKQ